MHQMFAQSGSRSSKCQESIKGGNLSVSFLVRDSDSAAVDAMGTTTFDDCVCISTLNANGMVDVEFPLRELARALTA